MPNPKAYSKEWFQTESEAGLKELLELGGRLAQKAQAEFKRRSEVGFAVSRGEVAVPVWGKPDLYMVKSGEGMWANVDQKAVA